MDSYVIFPDGRIDPASPASKYWTLAELQGLVGGVVGLLEELPGAAGYWMVIHEEGLRWGEMPNLQASQISGERLVGKVVVIPQGSLK